MVEAQHRKQASLLLIPAAVALVVTVAVVFLFSRLAPKAAPPQSTALSTESGLDAILKRGVIRAAYVSNPPSCIVDPNTKKVSGIVADTIENIAQSLGLRVEWTEEVGFGSMVEGLRANRYDMVPCAIWPTAARAREADFTRPLFYSAVGAYVRPGEQRLRALSDINSPDVRIATIDGELAETIARTQFPKAKTVGQPQMTEITNMLLNVQQRKADVALVELYFAAQFLKNNPGGIQRLSPAEPVRVFPDTILIPRNQPALKAFLNTAIEEQLNLGAIDRTIARYEPLPGTFYRVRQPFTSGAPQ